MKMQNKVCRKYLRDVKAKLPCSGSVKQVLIKDLGERISEFAAEQQISYDELCLQFGTPAEVAHGFEGAEVSSDIKTRAKRYFKAKIAAAVLAALLVAVAVLLVVIVKETSGRVEVSNVRDLANTFGLIDNI